MLRRTLFRAEAPTPARPRHPLGFLYRCFGTPCPETPTLITHGISSDTVSSGATDTNTQHLPKIRTFVPHFTPLSSLILCQFSVYN